MTCSFDGGFHCPLLLSSETCTLSAHDTAVRVHELLEKVHVLVIDVADVVLSQDIVRHMSEIYNTRRLPAQELLKSGEWL